MQVEARQSAGDRLPLKLARDLRVEDVICACLRHRLKPKIVQALLERQSIPVRIYDYLFFDDAAHLSNDALVLKHAAFIDDWKATPLEI